MEQLIIVLSGRKQSGKSSTSNYIRAKYLNIKTGDVNLFRINEEGQLTVKTRTEFGCYEYCLADELCVKQIEEPSNDVKIYSFADPLKDFCVNVLGAPYESCWGTDEQKNTPISHLLWEKIPFGIRWNSSKNKQFGSDTVKEYLTDFDMLDLAVRGGSKLFTGERTGPMTGRELMQIFGTNICRKLYDDCWAKGTYNKIKSEGYQLAICQDGRFANEISLGMNMGAKTIRLARKVSEDNHPSESALDNFPIDKYTVYTDNSNMTLDEQCAFIDPYVNQWFLEVGIV